MRRPRSSAAIAAISVSGPTTRVDWDFGDRAVPLLREAAERLCGQLAQAG